MAKHFESSAMTGADLLELLSMMTPEMLAKPVVFAFPANDHWRNTLAGEVSQIDEGDIVYSSYHTKFQVLDEEQVHKAEQRMEDARSEGEDIPEDAVAEYDNQPILKALVITM